MKSKLVLTLTAAFIGLAALSSKAAYSEGLNCANWSFNTPGCPAYIDRTNKAPVNVAALDSKQETVNCANWSFNTPGCSAYIDRTNKAPVNVAALNSKQETVNCANWSFNTPGCSAYIERKSIN